MFKDGDSALQVTRAGWAGTRSYRVVTIGKVHKTGRVTLAGSRDQWRYQKGVLVGEPDYFVLAKSGTGARLYHDTPGLRKEIDDERQAGKNRLKLNAIGDALSRIRNNEEAANLLARLPAEFHDLIDPS